MRAIKPASFCALFKFCLSKRACLFLTFCGIVSLFLFFIQSHHIWNLSYKNLWSSLLYRCPFSESILVSWSKAKKLKTKNDNLGLSTPGAGLRTLTHQWTQARGRPADPLAQCSAVIIKILQCSVEQTSDMWGYHSKFAPSQGSAADSQVQCSGQ